MKEAKLWFGKIMSFRSLQNVFVLSFSLESKICKNESIHLNKYFEITFNNDCKKSKKVPLLKYIL